MLEDSPLDADLILARLRRAKLNFEATRVDSRQAFINTLGCRDFDVILADYALPDFDGISALSFAREHCPNVPFIIVSGVLGEEHAIDALQRGAVDYVLKPRLDRLPRAVERALSEARRETESRKAQAELHKWQEFCRRVLESSHDCIMTVAPDGTIQSVNTYGIVSMGIPQPTPESALNWYEVWDAADRDLARSAFARAPESGAESFESSTRTPDGKTCYWDVLVTPVLDSEGNPTEILSVARDVTDRRRAEQERIALLSRERQARADAENKAVKLQQSIEDLEHFASIASHDLKEPLRTVTMYCQMLSKKYDNRLDGEAKDYLTYIEQGTRRMSLLLHDLLSYSRVVHEEDEPAELVDLNSVIEDAMRNCSVAIGEAGAEVDAGKLPTIRGHRLQIVQVFQNLIGNAVKYRSTRPLRIEIRCEQLDGEFLISVSDNGIGFDSRYAERIFGIFKRLHGQEYPGTGIGLAICHRVVERHHGRIWAEGEAGKGATFRLTFPAIEAVEVY